MTIMDIIVFLLVVAFTFLLLNQLLEKNSLQLSWYYLKQDKEWIIVSPKAGVYRLQNDYVAIFYEEKTRGFVEIDIQKEGAIGAVTMQFQDGMLQSISELTTHKNSGFTVSENFICQQILNHAKLLIHSSVPDS